MQRVCNPSECELLKLKSDLSLELDKPDISEYTIQEAQMFFNGIEPLILVRQPDSFGKLYFRDVFICDTGENPDTLIKEGIYKLEYNYSPKFKKFLYEISGVPNRSRLLIHQGNYPKKDSSGCVLVGVRKGDVLQYSTITLERLMFIIKDCQICFIKIVQL